MNDEHEKLKPADPDSEACFEALKKAIAWELKARVAVGDDPKTPEGLETLSALVADTVLDEFVVRERKTKRYL